MVSFLKLSKMTISYHVEFKNVHSSMYVLSYERMTDIKKYMYIQTKIYCNLQQYQVFHPPPY